MNKKNEDNSNLIEENTLMFVAIHELGHIASETIGHNDEFWYNFKFLLENAVKINPYDNIPIHRRLIDKKNSKVGLFDLGNHILIVGFILIVIFISFNVTQKWPATL